ncbi:MAG: hypothetical protein ACOZFS_15315 [Thermodesulfobacteriota bacterium]
MKECRLAVERGGKEDSCLRLVTVDEDKGALGGAGAWTDYTILVK